MSEELKYKIGDRVIYGGGNLNRNDTVIITDRNNDERWYEIIRISSDSGFGSNETPFKVDTKIVEIFENGSSIDKQWYREKRLKRILESDMKHIKKFNEMKLDFSDWLDKYFEKDDDHTYYTWTYTDDGMHPNDKARWQDDDLLNEYERYISNDEGSYVGLYKYDE